MAWSESRQSIVADVVSFIFAFLPPFTIQYFFLQGLHFVFCASWLLPLWLFLGIPFIWGWAFMAGYESTLLSWWSVGGIWFLDSDQFAFNVQHISKFSARRLIIGLVSGILGLPWLCDEKVMKMRQFAGLDIAWKGQYGPPTQLLGVSTSKVVRFWSHCQVSW